jgi:hypothetical protein
MKHIKDYNAINWESYFYYDETSPSKLRWKIDIYKGIGRVAKVVRKHDVAGSLHKTKRYWRVVLNKSTYVVHRIIFKMQNKEYNLLTDDLIDHIDRDKTNNSIDNLRLVCNSVNHRNMKLSVRNKSGITGVCRTTNKDGISVWRVTFRKLDSTQGQKVFSINKYGEENARQMAIDYRDRMIDELNRQGAGYTENHGKD